MHYIARQNRHILYLGCDPVYCALIRAYGRLPQFQCHIIISREIAQNGDTSVLVDVIVQVRISWHEINWKYVLQLQKLICSVALLQYFYGEFGVVIQRLEPKTLQDGCDMMHWNLACAGLVRLPHVLQLQ